MRLSERRMMERFPIEIEMCRMFYGETGDRFTGGLQVENICAGGAFIKTEQKLPVGTDVTLKMVLPLKMGNRFLEKRSHISVAGAVIRANAEGIAVGFRGKYSIRPYTGKSMAGDPDT